jgi:peptide/nickel transport system permease protein
MWQQYLNFWGSLLQGDLGVSIWLPGQPVADILIGRIPYSLAVLLPAVLLSWWAGNRFGAFAARKPWLDNSALPLGYILRATPEMWLGLILVWVLGIQLNIFPIAGAYAFSLSPNWTSPTFLRSVLMHWFLPFASMFIVMFGGWAIGMRNLIIYEFESDYSRYLQAIGAPQRLIRRYAFRNAMLPQITGLALQLGVIVAGAVVTEIVFAYPGLGLMIYQAIINNDYFLLQGAFLFIIIGVLVANFCIDIAYVLVDPRTRTGMQGGTA